MLSYSGLRMIEWGMDARARIVKIGLWVDGLRRRGWHGAFDAAAGLSNGSVAAPGGKA